MKLSSYLVVLVFVFRDSHCDLSLFDDYFFEHEPLEPVGPVATIPTLGQVRGSQMTSEAGRSFYAFRGIPYAKPPVGELRFRVRILEVTKKCVIDLKPYYLIPHRIPYLLTRG